MYIDIHIYVYTSVLLHMGIYTCYDGNLGSGEEGGRGGGGEAAAEGDE